MDWKALRREVLGSKGFAAKLRKKELSPKKLAETAQSRVMAKIGAINCDNINAVLCQLLDMEYELYLELEQEALFERVAELAMEVKEEFPAINRLIQECLNSLKDDSLTEQEKLTRAAQLLSPLYKFVFESFAQGRRARAGNSAQYHVAFVLDQLGFQGLYERQRTLNGTVDFLFPNLNMWKRDRRRCTILSIKRSLRERYKQIYEELRRTGGLTIYLLVTETADEARKDITDEKISNLRAENVYLVVRDEIKQNRFSQESLVLGFTDLFCRELPRLKTAWTSRQ
ncbi:MAG: type II restriction endonuclease [Thermofilaceae archaeon]